MTVSKFSDYLIIGMIVVGFTTLIVMAWKEVRSPGEVDSHIDSERNVICYTWKTEMQCFLYHDEGTHLELQP